MVTVCLQLTHASCQNNVGDKSTGAYTVKTGSGNPTWVHGYTYAGYLSDRYQKI